MSPEAERILEIFRRRSIRAGGFINFTDFGEAIPWKDGFIRDEPVRLAFMALVADGYVVENPTGLELTKHGEDHLYGVPKHGARVYLVGPRILVKQTVLRGTPPEYAIDEHRERHVNENDDSAIAAAIRDAVRGRL
jgi:hypothetical protein